MNTTLFKLIRQHVADLLNAAAPMLTPESQLLADVRLFVRPAPTQAEFEHVIARMEEDGQIIRHRDVDEGMKLKLSEVGVAELVK
jgi:hypothetical protein